MATFKRSAQSLTTLDKLLISLSCIVLLREHKYRCSGAVPASVNNFRSELIRGAAIGIGLFRILNWLGVALVQLFGRILKHGSH